MRRYWMLGLLLIAFAAPYTVSHYLALAMGRWSGTGVHADGTVSTFTSDIRLKPPSWLTLPPGALVSAATRTDFKNKPGKGGTIEFVVPMDVPALRAFFTTTLTSQGFIVTDDGLGTMDPATARAIGVAGLMSARRASGGEFVAIKFREEEGWFRKKQQVQLGWKAPG